MKLSGWSLKRNILVEEDHHIHHSYLAEQLTVTIAKPTTRLRLDDRMFSGLGWEGDRFPDR